MKTIYILNWHNTYNYGTFMMLINFISYTHTSSKDKDVNFIVDFLENSDLSRLEKELQNKDIKVDILISKKNPPIRNIGDKFKKLFFMLFQFQKEVLKYKPDTVVVLGWDDFSEYYGKIPVAIYMKILVSLNEKVPLFFVWQTIWPFTTGYNKKIAGELFSNVDITLRDTLCYNYMKTDLNIPESKMKCFSDLAFLDLPNQENSTKKDEFKLINWEYIVFVASGLYFKYTENKVLYTQELLKIISYLREKHPKKKIVFLWHVLLPEIASDNNVIDYIKTHLGNSKEYIYIQEKMLPSEARDILSGWYLTITGRMHAAISTLQTGKPAISLSYSVKYKWIISDDMKLPELVVESKWEDLWANWDVLKLTSQAIDYVDENYDSLSTRIKKSVNEAKNLSIENIQYFNSKSL